jgi:hypothetical protein
VAFYTKPTLLPEKASAGYRLEEGGLTWDLGTLQPGDSQSRTVQCSCAKEDLAAEVRATLASDQGISRTATASTTIVALAPRARESRPVEPASPGPPEKPPSIPSSPVSDSLRVSVADTADPIRVGATSSYVIVVQNDRQVADRNVVVTFALSPGLEFRRFDSGGLPLVVERRSPDGRTISLSQVKELRPGETLRAMRVETTATQPGTQIFHVEVTSQRAKEPVVDEEETTVQGS